MTNPARMASLQAAYDNRTDPRFDDRSDEHIDSIAVELFDDLLTAGGSSNVDDERVQLNLDIEAMRKAYRLFNDADPIKALMAFKEAFEDACRAAANEEAPGVYDSRCRAAEEAAAEDRAERRRGY